MARDRQPARPHEASRPPALRPPPGGRTMTMDAVIERATSQSRRLGHDYVGTEHALLAIVDDDPALLEPYGVTRERLLQVLTMELLRIIVELRDARSIVEPVRQAA